MLPREIGVIQRTVLYRTMVGWRSQPVHIAHGSTKDQFKRLLKHYHLEFNG